MNYTLTLNLEGDGVINDALNAMIAKVGALQSAFSGGLGKSGPIISRETSDNIATATKGLTGAKQAVRDIATAAAHGAKEVGTFFSTLKDGSKVTMSPKVLAMMSKEDRDRELARMSESESEVLGSSKSKFKGVYWTSKEMLGSPRVPDVSAFLPNDENKSHKGLPDVTGADLAKVLNSGTIEGHMEEDAKKAEAIRQRSASKAEKDLESFTKNMSLIVGPIFNPGGALTTAFAARQVFSAFTTQKGQSLLGKFGLGSGVGGAALGTGIAVAGATAIGVALIALKKVVEAVTASFGRALTLYSAALQNGMGLQFTAKRSALANILGVSEKDIFQFGAQVAYLSPKIKAATDILARTATPLANVSANWKIFILDLEASVAQLAVDVAPAVNTFIVALDNLFKWLNEHAKQLEILAVATSPGFAVLDLISKLLANRPENQPGNGLPSPQSWMKQLPASHWEHMGLVVGTGGPNYPQQIANNTKDMVGLLKGNRRGNGGIDPKSQWGLMPTVNNP